MLRLTLAGVLAIATWWPVAAGSAIAHRAGVSVHDLTAMPFMAVSANFRIRKVLGEVGTFMIGEFKAGWVSAPHHHSYEQINVGLNATYVMPLAGAPHRVAALQGVLIPPEVTHNNDVSGVAESALAIEFQNLRRPDFPPEREKLVLPRGPAALPVSDGQQVRVDFAATSAGWTSVGPGVRTKSVRGASSSVMAVEIGAAARETTELLRQLPRSEQFVYLVEGSAEAEEGATRYALAAGSLLVNPPGGDMLRMRAGTATPAMLLVFEALPVPAR